MTNLARSRSGLWEQTPEGLDGALNHLRQSEQSWKQGLTLEDLTPTERYATERYANLKLQSRVHVKRLIPAEANDYCAIFQWGGRAVSSQKAEIDELLANVDKCSLGNGRYGQQEMMLIRYIESMQRPQGIIPALVRFGRLEEAHRILAGSLYFSQIDGFKFLDGISEGECDPTAWSCSREAKNKLPDQNIQTGSEIVENVSDYGAESDRNAIDDAKAEASSGMRSILGDNLVWVRCFEPFNFDFKLTDVLFGPFDLRVNVNEGRMHGWPIES